MLQSFTWNECQRDFGVAADQHRVLTLAVGCRSVAFDPLLVWAVDSIHSGHFLIFAAGHSVSPIIVATSGEFISCR